MAAGSKVYWNAPCHQTAPSLFRRQSSAGVQVYHTVTGTDIAHIGVQILMGALGHVVARLAGIAEVVELRSQVAPHILDQGGGLHTVNVGQGVEQVSALQPPGNDIGLHFFRDFA